jgi:hypothetical protein
VALPCGTPEPVIEQPVPAYRGSPSACSSRADWSAAMKRADKGEAAGGLAALIAHYNGRARAAYGRPGRLPRGGV